MLQKLPVGTTATFYFRDLGAQISWVTVRPASSFPLLRPPAALPVHFPPATPGRRYSDQQGDG